MRREAQRMLATIHGLWPRLRGLRNTGEACGYVQPPRRGGALVRRLGHAGADQCRAGAGQESQRPALVCAVAADRATGDADHRAAAEGASEIVLSAAPTKKPRRGRRGFFVDCAGAPAYSPSASRMNSGCASAALWVSA